jgi:hypothetical protein
MGLADHCGAGLCPLRPSRASRANGAWSWAAVNADGVPLPLGSHWSMAELLAAPRLIAHRDTTGAGDIDIDPASAEDANWPTGKWLPARGPYSGPCLIERLDD